MNREHFRQELATVEGYISACQDLLVTLSVDHFSLTREGALEQYQKARGVNEAYSALFWMADHYDSILAMVRAAEHLAGAATTTVEPLWTIAGKLIKEEEENKKHD